MGQRAAGGIEPESTRGGLKSYPSRSKACSWRELRGSRETRLAVLLLLFRTPDAFAHEVRLADPQVQQTRRGPTRCSALPGRGDACGWNSTVALPTHCATICPERLPVNNAFTERRKVKCCRGSTDRLHSRSRCHDDRRAGAPRATRRDDAGDAAYEPRRHSSWRWRRQGCRWPRPTRATALSTPPGVDHLCLSSRCSCWSWAGSALWRP